MHLVAGTLRTLDETADAVDLAQTPADVAMLSFSDSDLAVAAAVHDAADGALPSLRLASLADLRHPYSVDLWIASVAAHARFVLVRLLGGLDYWRYGVEELAAAARAHGVTLAVVPGDAAIDERLDRASTLPVDDLRRLWRWFQEGGPDNVASALAWIAGRIGSPRPWHEPQPLAATAEYRAARREGAGPTALIVFYRSFVAAADTAPIVALADALAAQGFSVVADHVTSLKDPRVVAALAERLDRLAPAIVINTTAFSARLDDGTSVLDRAGVPVLQAFHSTAARESWLASSRGLGAADLAMNVVLPEIDGRIATRAISFKGREARSDRHQWQRQVHVPDAEGIAAVAALARAWVRLAETPRALRRIGLVVSDYPAKRGRTAYAVGLDTPASLVAIAEDLAAAGFDVPPPPEAAVLMEMLEGRAGAEGGAAAGEAPVLERPPAAAPFPSPLVGEGGAQRRMRGLGEAPPAEVAIVVPSPPEGEGQGGGEPPAPTSAVNDQAPRPPSLSLPLEGGEDAGARAIGSSTPAASAARTLQAVGSAPPLPVPSPQGRRERGGDASGREATAGEAPVLEFAAAPFPSPPVGEGGAQRRMRGLGDAPPAALAIVVPSPPEGEGQGGGEPPAPTPAVNDQAPRPPSLSLPLEGGEDAGARAIGSSTPAASATLPLAAYAAAFAALPPAFRDRVTAAWGDPAADPDVADGNFRFAVVELGRLTIAVQPDRGRRDARKGEYHDTNLPPRHGYVAFYLWLREVGRIDAMIHLGTHGTLEWLPGKAAAAAGDCAPTLLLGPVPVIYPFVVNNPGEAAQAKRRIAAVTVGHLTPPLMRAGAHGAAAEIEALLDEFSQAQGLDARRARLIAAAVLDKARDSGLAAESGIAEGMDPAEALVRLDAWLCDLKDARIGDGLHVFGRAASPALGAAAAETLSEGLDPALTGDLAERLAACAAAERAGLLAALDGRFVAPGPAGALSSGRLDVLPTGRNLHAVDPRGVPTRTAWEIGRRTADEVIARYVQDHGDWPQRIVLDLWGSATMRTGGDDLAQAFALIGARPVWDAASARLSGFEILKPAVIGRPRVDVTLRISGLFRDVFESQIALYDDAVRAIAALDEDDATNPLAAAVREAGTAPDAGWRIFGAAPGAYGTGLSVTLATGGWDSRDDLGMRYLAASAHAFGRDAAGIAAPEAFADRVAAADAFVHVQDMVGQDVLDSDAFAEHEGGFAAAAASLGATPALYHADTTRRDRPAVRSLAQEIARVVRSRAANPRWLAGQMRHGHRGGAEIAETVANLVAFAAMTDAVTTTAFDLAWDATLGDDAVRAFLIEANPRAAAAVAASFETALSRGLWASRRNSVAGRIGETLEATG